MILTDQQWAEFRAGCGSATPGPWKTDRKHCVGPISDADDQTFGMLISIADCLNNEDAKHIARLDPATVLAMCDERDALKARHAADQAEIARLKRHRQDLFEAGNRLLERARAAEADVARLTKERDEIASRFPIPPTETT